MDKYTLKPIAWLLRQPRRAGYSHADFTQLAARWKSSDQQPAPEILKIYQEALEELKKHCPPGKKITREEVISIIDKFMRTHQLYYMAEAKKCARENYFLSKDLDPRKAYDLAFYHPQAAPNSNAHHKIHNQTVNSPKELMEEILGNLSTVAAGRHPPETVLAMSKKIVAQTFEEKKNKITPELSSVFYLRAERFADSLLIGNMQIDARDREKHWEQARYATTLGRNKNIFRIMVQGAIRHALQTGDKKIIFQAGYANQITQSGEGDSDFIGREYITAENIVKHQDNYRIWRKIFKQMKPGQLFYRPGNYPDDDPERCVIINVTAKGFTYYRECFENLLLMVYDLSWWDGFRPGITPEKISMDLEKKINIAKMVKIAAANETAGIFCDHSSRLGKHFDYSDISERTYQLTHWQEKSPTMRWLHEVHQQFYIDLVKAYAYKDPAQMLYAIDKIFDYVVKIDFTARNPEKIKYLESLCAAPAPLPREYDSDEHKEPFFKIIQPFLIKFDYHKLLLENFPTLRQVQKDDGPPGFYDRRDGIISQSFPEAPVVGGLAPRTFTCPDIGKPIYPVRPDNKMYRWYEDTLREVFKELDLAFRRTPLVTTKVPKNYGTAYGWEIITPAEELRQRQMICV